MHWRERVYTSFLSISCLMEKDTFHRSLIANPICASFIPRLVNTDDIDRPIYGLSLSAQHLTNDLKLLGTPLRSRVRLTTPGPSSAWFEWLKFRKIPCHLQDSKSTKRFHADPHLHLLLSCIHPPEKSPLKNSRFVLLLIKQDRSETSFKGCSRTGYETGPVK